MYKLCLNWYQKTIHSGSRLFGYHKHKVTIVFTLSFPSNCFLNAVVIAKSAHFRNSRSFLNTWKCVLAFSLRFPLKHHCHPSSQSSCKYSVFQFFIFTGRMWIPNHGKNLTVFAALCTCRLYVYGESFNVICWNIFKGCHLVQTKLMLLSRRLWSIHPTSWFDEFSLWINLIAWLFGHLQTPLHKEKAGFTLTC